MNYKKSFVLFSIITAILCGFSSFDNQKETHILIETNVGNIKLKLYNETPKHRDNFIKLVKEHYYDSVLFHRCIQNFMIQSGDPDSKKAKPNVVLGEGGPEYTIPAEFNTKLFHKRGVLAAARESDLDNLKQESSGSQFYIVQGKVFNDSLLRNVLAKRITKMKLFNEIINREENKIYVEKYQSFAKNKNTDSANFYYSFFDKKVDAEFSTVPLYKFSDEQIQAYSTIGGTPHLDGSYTVFGEVTEGMNVVEMIAAQKTDENNRPKTDIRIIKMSIIP